MLSVPADLGVSSFMETSEMMTNRPTIPKMSKDYEMTKFRELLYTVKDDSVSTKDWLVRQSPRGDEKVLAMAMDTKRTLAMSTEI